jgi:hypothetical protein
MRGETVREKVMAKRFEKEKRTLDEGIIANEVIVIPQGHALQRRHPGNKTEPGNDQTPKPVAIDEGDERHAVGLETRRASFHDRKDARH